MLSKHTIKFTSILLFNIIFVFVVARWFLNDVDLESVFVEARLLDQNSILLTIILGCFLFVFYGLRLALLLDLRLFASSQIAIMGFGLNALLPFRIGEVLKIIFTKQFFKVDLTNTSFATLIEKSLDLIIIGCLSLIFVFGHVGYYIVIWLMLVILCFLFISFNKFKKINLNNKTLEKIVSIIKLMLAKNKHRGLVFSTLGIWLITWYLFYMFFHSNINSKEIFNSYDAIMLLILTTLSLSIPSMPGSIGLFESGIIYYLISNYSFTLEKAISYALVFHLLIIMPQVIFTLVILLFNSINLVKQRQVLYDS